MIAAEVHNGTMIVKLDRGVTNALILELIQELSEAIDRVESDPDVHSLVLTSANEKFFSIGFDIPELFDLPEADFRIFYQAFNRLCLKLYMLPKPSVAAISGHAIAGGCILTLCCDERFIAAGRKLIGLNEIKLGVPVPYVADCLLRDWIGARLARQVMEGGEFYPPGDALKIGMVDRISPLDEVLARSLKRAGALGSLPSSAMQAIKTSRVERMADQIQAQLGEKEAMFIECWYADDTRARLREAMEKF